MNANAIPISPETFPEENGHESDGDANDDRSTTTNYYQPISANSDSDSDDTDTVLGSSHLEHSDLPNGYFSMDHGVSALHMNDDGVDHKCTEDDDSSEDEVGLEEDSDAAIHRAFREDESRRAAPLNVENAARVMEAMRGVRFPGSAPDWAQRMPEDQLLAHLHSLRQPPSNN